MSTNVTLNAVTYAIPAVGESNWGAAVSSYLIALSTGVLQKAGGAFTLTAEVDFGATYGLKSAYFKSRGTVAAAGVVRLANTELISWRNAANSADLGIRLSASNWIQFNSVDLADISTAQTLTNKTVDVSANTFTNIVNANISASAAIARSKLASGTASHVLINDGSGVMSSEAQLDKTRGGTGITSTATFPSSGTVTTDAGVSTFTNKTFDVDGSGNSLTNIANANIKAGAAIARSKLAAGTADHVLIHDASGVMSSEAQLAKTRGGTGVSSTATFPSSGTVTTDAGATTLTNKSIDADANTITNIENADIKAGAAIAVNKLAALTASRAVATDGSGFVSATSVTSTELGYLSGVTSGIQAQLNALASTQIVSKSADYTILDNDSVRTILVTTSTTNRTMTLPTAADNTHRIITIKKVDSASGKVIVDGEGAEQINAATTFDLHVINDYVTVQCNGTKWEVIDQKSISAAQSLTCVFAATTLGTLAASTVTWRRVLNKIRVDGTVTASGSIGGSNITLDLPLLASAAAAAVVATTHASGLQIGRWVRNNASATTRKQGNIFAIGNGSNNFVYFSSDDQAAAVNPFTAVAANSLFGASDVISFWFEVPVTDFAHWGA